VASTGHAAAQLWLRLLDISNLRFRIADLIPTSRNQLSIFTALQQALSIGSASVYIAVDILEVDYLPLFFLLKSSLKGFLEARDFQ